MLQHALTETLGREWETEKYVGLGEKAAGRVSSLFPIHCDLQGLSCTGA